jgi:hypothetical protein
MGIKHPGVRIRYLGMGIKHPGMRIWRSCEHARPRQMPAQKNCEEIGSLREEIGAKREKGKRSTKYDEKMRGKNSNRREHRERRKGKNCAWLKNTSS